MVESNGLGIDSRGDSSSDVSVGDGVGTISSNEISGSDGLFTEGGRGTSSGYNCLVSTTLPGDEGIVEFADGAMLTTSSRGSASSGFAQRHSAVL